MRLFFQYASEEEFCRPVEQAMGRKVMAFISGIDTKPTPRWRCFVLPPPGHPCSQAAAEVDALGASSQVAVSYGPSGTSRTRRSAPGSR
jgi:hypothetical protein